mgnify:FL=1
MTQEFPLCGHATLASSHVLFTTHHPDASVLHFETMSGLLIARRMEGGSIQLDFPADAGVLTNAVEGKDLDKLVMGVRKACSSVERLDLEVVCYAKGELGWVVELSTNVDLEELKIDSMAELVSLLDSWRRGGAEPAVTFAEGVGRYGHLHSAWLWFRRHPLASV